MNSYGLILSAAFLFCALLAALFGFLKGRKYVWHYSIARFIIVILSVIASVIISKLISGAISDALYGVINESVLEGDTKELINSLPSAPEAFKAIVTMIISPVLFYPVFIIFRAIANSFSALLAILLVKLTDMIKKKENGEDKAIAQESPVEDAPKKKKTKKRDLLRTKGANPIGSICGALCGVIIFCIYLIPLACGLDVASSVVSMVTDNTAENDGMAIVSEVSEGLSNNVGTHTIKALGGNVVYSSLTSYRFNETRTNLPKESDIFSSLGKAAISLSDEEVAKEEKIADMKAVSVAFEKAQIVPTLAAELISGASSAWENGEDYYGIKCPNDPTDPIMSDLISSILVELDESTPETIKEDVNTIIEVIVICIEDDVIENASENLLGVLENVETNQKLLKVLLDSDRLYVVVGTLSNLGIDIISDSLGIRQEFPGSYDDFVGEMTAAVASVYSEGIPAPMSARFTPLSSDVKSEDKLVELSKAIKKVFHKYGLKVTDDGITGLAQTILDEIAPTDAVSKDKINNVFKNNDVEIKDKSGKVTKISLDSDAAIIKNSTIVTVDSLYITNNKVTDTEKEAAAFADLLAGLNDLANAASSSDNNVGALIENIGPMLDSFASTETIGADTTANLLTALLQSEFVETNLGISPADAAEIADTMNAKTSENSSYTDLTASLGSTVKVIEAASGNKPVSVEEIKVMINDLTPESAEILEKLSSSEMLEKFGVKHETALPASNMISSMFKKLADAKENGFTDDQYDKESNAVSDLLNLTMNMSTTHSSSKEVFGKDSMTGITATEYVKRIVDSKVISETLIETVYGSGNTPTNDPLRTGIKLSDADAAELVAALDAYVNSDTSSNAAEKTANAIAAFMNLSAY